MKATIIVVVLLCLIVGGITGWALRSVTSSTRPVAMIDVTSQSYPESSSRIAVYEGGTLTVMEYNRNADGGSIEHMAKMKIR